MCEDILLSTLMYVSKTWLYRFFKAAVKPELGSLIMGSWSRFSFTFSFLLDLG